jgi:hypothetical protein
LLSFTRLGAASAAFAHRRAAAGHQAGAREETGNAEPCQEPFQFLSVHNTPPLFAVMEGKKDMQTSIETVYAYDEPPDSEGTISSILSFCQASYVGFVVFYGQETG